MRYRCLLITSVLLLSVTAHAQWLNFPTPGVPRTKTGAPNLGAPTPRTAEGKPDLSGVWMHAPTPIDELKRLFGPLVDQEIQVEVPGMEVSTVHKYAVNILADFSSDKTPLTPAGAEAFRRHTEERDFSRVCTGVPSWPMAGLLSEPIKIVQAPKITLVLYEDGRIYRQIYSDGRALPAEYAFPAFLGYSAARWEGDVFVADTAGFNDKTALDIFGHRHSESLRITERIRRRDYGHLEMDVTFTDAEMLTRPVTLHIPYTLQPDSDIFESVCENERVREQLQNATPSRAPIHRAPL
jgi:hypothetical protein